MMRCILKLISDKIIWKGKLNKESTITDLLYSIEKKFGLEYTPFHIIYNTNILTWNDETKLYEIFISNEPIILIIIKSREISEYFPNVNNFIEYINETNVCKSDHLQMLAEIYNDDYEYIYNEGDLLFSNSNFIMY